VSDAPLLHAINIHKRFGSNEVLKGIDLDVARGEVVALVGSSGSGKTTFLRCVNMLEEYHEGQILLDGESIGYRVTNGARKRLPEHRIEAQRARIGIVFQSFNLLPHLTAEQNITLGLTKVMGRSKPEARDIAARWLERVGLAERRNYYPYQLSGGQQQRVAIARRRRGAKARAVRRSNFGARSRAGWRGAGRDAYLAEAGMTMLVVSHEMLFVRAVASRVVFLEQGRVAEQGAPEELFRNPSSERLRIFLGRFHQVFR